MNPIRPAACARFRRSSFVDVERRRHGSIPGDVDAAISLERTSGTVSELSFLRKRVPVDERRRETEMIYTG